MFIIKNPYKLIEKANNTFNLYLDKYDEFEKYINDSKKEQYEIKKSINLFLEQYNINQKRLNDINYKFLVLFEKLIDADSTNKELLKNLESEFEELNNFVNFSHKKSFDLLKNSNIKLDEFNHSLEDNVNSIRIHLNEVSTSIFHNRDLIGLESEKQLAEIKALGESVSDGFLNNKNLIHAESAKSFNEINKFSKMQMDFNDTYLNNQNNIKNLLDAQIDVNDNLDKAVKLFVQNYDDCKRFFFNDEEDILKEYLNTDDLFRTCYFNNIKFLSYSPSENRILLETKEGIILGTNNRFYTIKEVIGFDGYSVPQLYQFDDFVVFDIGMNRAYASLRFAEFNNCSAVYGFEIDEETYNKAIDNINLNPSLSKKIIPYNFGLSNENEQVELYYLQGADGVSTVEPDMVDVQYELKNKIDRIKSKTVEVKKTSEVLNRIIEDNKIDSKLVLKVDTEGSEYNIIDDLIESGLINKIDLIVGEGHKFNNRNISEDLLRVGFKEIEYKDQEIVYNFAFIKEEYYNIWPLNIW